VSRFRGDRALRQRAQIVWHVFEREAPGPIYLVQRHPSRDDRHVGELAKLRERDPRSPHLSQVKNVQTGSARGLCERFVSLTAVVIGELNGAPKIGVDLLAINHLADFLAE
jgi:hypothetical protein